MEKFILFYFGMWEDIFILCGEVYFEIYDKCMHIYI